MFNVGNLTALLHMFMVYYHLPVVLNDLSYYFFYFFIFLVVVSKHMPNNKIKLYIGYGTSMFVNVVSCVACLSIMCRTTSSVRMHMLLFFVVVQKFFYIF
jgi:hypothetical protein